MSPWLNNEGRSLPSESKDYISPILSPYMAIGSCWDDKYNTPLKCYIIILSYIHISACPPSPLSGPASQPSNILEEKSLALIFLYTWNAKDHWKIAFFSRKGFKAEELFILTTKPCILSHFLSIKHWWKFKYISFLISSIGLQGFL